MNGRLMISILLAGAILVVVAVHLLGSGHSLAEEAYNVESPSVNSSIQSCSQRGDSITITGLTSATHMGLVSVTLYALTGPRKYSKQRIVTLGVMTRTQGQREWSASVASSTTNQWGCGVRTTIGPVPYLGS
jgi:hypothetical protein